MLNKMLNINLLNEHICSMNTMLKVNLLSPITELRSKPIQCVIRKSNIILHDSE